jgi:hypothetical protein
MTIRTPHPTFGVVVPLHGMTQIDTVASRREREFKDAENTQHAIVRTTFRQSCTASLTFSTCLCPYIYCVMRAVHKFANTLNLLLTSAKSNPDNVKPQIMTTVPASGCRWSRSPTDLALPPFLCPEKVNSEVKVKITTSQTLEWTYITSCLTRFREGLTCVWETDLVGPHLDLLE